MDTDLPRLSVVLGIQHRGAPLEQCLQALSQQDLDRSAVEILVVDWNPTEETRTAISRVAQTGQFHYLPVETANPVAALNRGWMAARGETVLFADSSYVLSPGALAQHLQLHSSQPANALIAGQGCPLPGDPGGTTLLAEYIQGLRNGRPATASELETPPHDLSVSRSLLAKVGGLDPALPKGDAAMIDLRLRLQSHGVRFEDLPGTQASRSDPDDLGTYQQERIDRARGHVALSRKHPHLLAQLPHPELSFRDCHEEVRNSQEEREQLEGAARELARIDLHPMEALEELTGEVRPAIRREFEEAMQSLEQDWHLLGTLQGMRDLGLAGLEELTPESAPRDPFHTQSARRLFAWPRWADEQELDELMDRLAPIAEDGFATLILRHDAIRDPEQSSAIAALQAAYTRRFPHCPDSPLEVVIESKQAGRREHFQWGRAVDALLPLGSEPRAFVRALGVEQLKSQGDVASWRQRFEPDRGLASSASPGSSTPRVLQE